MVNYDPPTETAGKQYALAIFLMTLSSVFAYLRFHARYLRKTAILMDDWLLLFALVSIIAFRHGTETKMKQLSTYATAILIIVGMLDPLRWI